MPRASPRRGACRTAAMRSSGSASPAALEHLGLVGGAEPVRGLERLVEDPLQLRRVLRHERAGPASSRSGSLSASTAASISASVYSRRGPPGHDRHAMAVRPHLPLPRRRLRLQALGRPTCARSSPGCRGRPTRACSSRPTPPTTPASSGSPTTSRSCRPSTSSPRSSTTRTRSAASPPPTRCRDVYAMGGDAGHRAEPRRLPARDARRRGAARDPARRRRRGRGRGRARSSAATRSTTPSRSTAWRSPAPCTPTRC